MIQQLLAIYGAGELGKLASKFLDEMNLNYLVVDDNPENYINDNDWEGKEVYCLDDLSKVEKINYLFLVCISTASYEQIKRKLFEYFVLKVKSFYQFTEEYQREQKHYITNGWRIKNPPKHLINNKYRSIELSFYDMYSKVHYTNFLNWHLNYIEDLHPDYPINCNNRYFIPEVVSVMHDHEVFLDIGAYDGRVSKKFMQIVQNQYDEIHCFEPDLNNSFKLFEPELNNSFKLFEKFKLEHPKISLYDIALGNKKGYINFLTGKGYCSKIWKQSKQKEIINKFDNIVELNDIKPTFIKIHTEGSELGVLKGAIKTIKQYRPIIAVTTYHTEDGLYKIPLYLMNRLTNYRFYWRNHNYQGQGSVLYCVPRERYNK